MKTKKQPRDLSDQDVEAMVSAFDDNSDDAYSVTDSATLAELRAAALARREAEGRIEATRASSTTDPNPKELRFPDALSR
jgi:hypothetical protein